MTTGRDTGAGPAARWQWARMDQLDPRELHDLLRLRQDVFVVEQDCAFPEIDGRDPHAWHLLGWRDGPAGSELVACARVFEPDLRTGTEGAPERAQASIGRVVTARSVRGQGLGRALMEEALRRTQELAPGRPIRVAAQSHLLDFYRELGFEPVGAEYMEDGIPHRDMVRP